MNSNNLQVNSFSDFKAKIYASDSTKQQFLHDPMKFLDQTIDKSPIEHKSVFLKIVYIVGSSLLLCIIVGTIVSIWFPIIELTNADGKIFQEKREIDSFFVMIASASIGALAGLLVPTPKSN